MTTSKYMLHHPAPAQASVEGPQGWYHRAWTGEDVREARRGGAWFLKGRHTFANREAAREAGVRDD